MKSYAVINLPKPTRARLESLLNDMAMQGWSYHEKHRDEAEGWDLVFEREEPVVVPKGKKP